VIVPSEFLKAASFIVIIITYRIKSLMHNLFPHTCSPVWCGYAFVKVVTVGHSIVTLVFAYSWRYTQGPHTSGGTVPNFSFRCRFQCNAHHSVNCQLSRSTRGIWIFKWIRNFERSFCCWGCWRNWIIMWSRGEMTSKQTPETSNE